jgi:hypothetical protein
MFAPDESPASMTFSPASSASAIKLRYVFWHTAKDFGAGSFGASGVDTIDMEVSEMSLASFAHIL